MKKKDDIIFDNSWLQQCGSREKNDIVRAPYTKKNIYEAILRT